MEVETTAIKTTYFSIFGNALLAIIKAIGGIFGNSYALIADAIESTGDVFSSLLVLFGMLVVLQMKITHTDMEELNL